MEIPSKLKNILEKDDTMNSLIHSIVPSFTKIHKKSTHYFFQEYTDHGIEHIEMVLKGIEYLIPDEQIQYLQPSEVAILILAVILHDIGMHTEFSTFKAMLEGRYNDAKDNILDNETWQELWNDYLSEARRFSPKEKETIFGDQKARIKDCDLSNIDNLDGVDKKLIGEFLRRNHARFAHEVALIGFIGNNEIIPFGNNDFIQYKHFAGIVARSHGIDIRKTYDYLKELYSDAWKSPGGNRLIYLMVLLRIADYLHIIGRTDRIVLKIKTFNSPLSVQEHRKHLAVSMLTNIVDDPELIHINCEPENSQIYVKLREFFRDIQNELDLSWAILGEVYGSLYSNKPEKMPWIKYRRIKSNLEDNQFKNRIKYIPSKVAFQVNNELSKLLVAPLYGNDPIYGVRELVQNATDACKERKGIEERNSNHSYDPVVEVSIKKENEDQYLFKIVDNGKGMTDNEIENYFLSVGYSFRQTYDWKKEFITEKNECKIKRNGKFGIGVLAAFLLGEKISVKTKSYKPNSNGYFFETELDSEHIDIIKINGLEIGTTIEITMDREKYELLIQYSPNDINWTDWYIDGFPRIRYFLEDNELFARKFVKLYVDRCFFSNKYGKIYWGYEFEWKYINKLNNKIEIINNKNDYDNEENGYADEYRDNDNNDSEYLDEDCYFGTKEDLFLVCNDIIITKSSSIKKFNYSKEININEYNTSIFLLPIPTYLIIEDTNGELPLELARNDLDIDELPFEDELIADIAKDFIAQLLILPETMHLYDNFYFETFPIEFLFNEKGYIINSDYFINMIKNNFILLNIDSNYNIHSNIKDFNILLKDNKHVLHFSRKISLEKGSCSIRRKKNSDKPVFAWGKNGYKTEWVSDKYICNSINNYKKESNIFSRETSISIMNNLGLRVKEVHELSSECLRKIKGGKILNELLKKYFNNNIFIPFEKEKRKEIFQLAFQELENYIKMHEFKIEKKIKTNI